MKPGHRAKQTVAHQLKWQNLEKVIPTAAGRSGGTCHEVPLALLSNMGLERTVLDPFRHELNKDGESNEERITFGNIPTAMFGHN